MEETRKGGEHSAALAKIASAPADRVSASFLIELARDALRKGETMAYGKTDDHRNWIVGRLEGETNPAGRDAIQTELEEYDAWRKGERGRIAP